mgnify:CR=1 FL=1
MIQLKRPSLLLLIPLLSFSAIPAIAAPAQQEQLDQLRAQEAERQERLGEERVETIVAPPPSTDLPADESVRFHIPQITIENQVERFRFLERIARPYKAFCQNTEFLLYPTVFLHQLSRLANAVNQGAEFRNYVLFDFYQGVQCLDEKLFGFCLRQILCATRLGDYCGSLLL